MKLPSFTTHFPLSRICLLAASLAIPSQAAVLASWDVWGDATEAYVADATTTGFSGSITISDTAERVLGTSGTPYGSNDGTFGTLSGASTDTTNFRALLVRKGTSSTNDSGYNVVTITLTNNTGFAYNINSIHFDLGVRGTGTSQSGDEFKLAYTSGGLGNAGTYLVGSATTTVPIGDTSFADREDQPDFDYTLSNFLSDITLASGESAVFTLTIDSYASNSASTALDNIAFQGTVVPEPRAALLGGLGLLALLRRRRS